MRIQMVAAIGAMWAAAVSPVAADDAAGGGATLSRLVEEATHAAQFVDMRFAFTMEFEQTQNDKRAAFKARYDPRLEEGARWALEGASPEDLDEHTRKAFESLQSSARGDDGVVYDKLGENLTQETISKVKLRSETDAEAIFAMPLVGDDAPEGVLELVLHFDKQRDYVSRVDVRMIDDFKPNPAVKINSMRQSQYFSAPEDGGPALLERSENLTTGSAMFRKFTSDTRMVYSDVEAVIVEAPVGEGGAAAEKASLQ